MSHNVEIMSKQNSLSIRRLLHYGDKPALSTVAITHHPLDTLRTQSIKDEATLAYVTEFLSANVAAFRDQHPSTNLHSPGVQHRSHWKETDRGEHVFDFMVDQAKLAETDGASSWFIADPLNGASTLSEISVVKNIVAASPMAETKLFDMESLSPRELKQLYNIQVAMRADIAFPSPGYTAAEEVRLQAYALDLMKCYFSAYDHSLNETMAGAPCRQLQTVFEVVLDTLCQKNARDKRQVQSCERRDEPGDDFDKELFQPFAWKYGKLFAEKLSELGAFPPEYGYGYGYFGADSSDEDGDSDDSDGYDEDYDGEA